MGAGDAAAMRAYHDATKHTLARLRRDPHTLDWAIMPRPFKVYPDLTALPLPRHFEGSTRPALAALADPGTAARATTPLDLTSLARLLYLSAGVLRRRGFPGGEVFFRAAACTGALYHIDLYLVCAAVPGLEAGVYHFGPHDFALRRLRAGDHRRTLVDASGAEPALADAPVIVAFTSTFWRNAWKYRARTYRHCFWDSGTILANLLAVAASAHLPARVVLGFADDPANRLLDLDPEREVTLGLVALGQGGPPAPPAPEPGPLDLAVLPLSEREIDYPAIRAAHAASGLVTPDDAAAWRLACTAAPGGAPHPAPLPPDTAPEPIEQVILQRGSTRVFAREPIALEALATILWTATRGVPADFAAPSAPYLIVNAVDGLEPGTYVFDREHEGLGRLEAGSFRREAGHLGLGQYLPADAAACVFWLADLHEIFARLGGRGYRAAQLEAAIEGGKTYLATYALGLGATGLTFFDDDVTAFFSPHGAGRSVMFLVALGRPARRTPA